MPSVKERVKLVWFGFGVTRSERIRRLSVEIIASILIGALVLFASRFGGRGYRELNRFANGSLVISIIGSMTLAAGYVAHWFKQKYQRIYGRVEMAFGTVSAYAIAAAFAPERAMLPQCASLIGCAYVIARGLNNISEADAKAIAALMERLTGMGKAVDQLSELTATLRSRDQMPSDPA